MNQQGLDAMRPAIRSSYQEDLQAYNFLVLRHQDEAFNLAYALLGNEVLAEKVVGTIFHEAFVRLPKNCRSFRCEILGAIIYVCLKQPKLTFGPEDIRTYLMGLTSIEKAVVVLVDTLEMSLMDAAGVLHISRLQLVKLLARGRSKIARALPEAF
jgi:DNA-directed RNA polymerase specialized sigma24 family protein